METSIKNLLIAESTYVDFKVALEKSRPKSWLKTVVAFANGTGGSILFGVDDHRKIIGLKDIQSDAEKISNLIKTKTDPLVLFDLKPIVIDERQVLILNVSSGEITPYYYVNEGTRTAYIRIGNESIVAPSYVIHELTLKGKRLSFDSLSTSDKLEDSSFTLFKSIFYKTTGKRIEGRKDYLSFGMVDKEDHLTYAGMLLSDECSLLQSRIFCTRWTGITKGKGILDAIDDKEYRGNIITILKEGLSFAKNHSKKAWKIEGAKRVEFIDYPEDAVREALVNALVHRDYGIIGSEIHIDIYDDRLEIVSPGGMYDGKSIQEIDIEEVASIRRNPIIADIFNRLDYMERRGSGLKRIKEAFISEDLINFRSNHSSFTVIMKKQIIEELQNERIMSGSERIMSGLNENEKTIIEFVLQNGKIANKKAVAITGLSSPQIRRIFLNLQLKNLIEPKGKGRGRYYLISKVAGLK